jgi:integrase
LSSRKGDGTLKVFHVHLSDAAREFFSALSVGRASSELVFRRNDGSAFGKSHQDRPFEEASARAGISPPVNFHCLRHTWASWAAMADTPLPVIARALGHADTRMVEKHYGHLAPSYQAAAIRAGAPDFKFKPDRTVVALKRQ